MTKHIVSFVVVVCLCATVFVGRLIPGLGAQGAQQTSRLSLTSDLYYPGIAAALFDPSQHTAYAKLFELPEWQQVAPFAIVITNASDRPLAGVVVRWQMQRGPSKAWSVFQADSFVRDDRAPVIMPRSSALLTPTGLITPEAVAGRFISGARPGPQTLESLRRESRIPVELDSLILDDGTVLGADAFAIGDYLRARRDAAQLLLGEIQRPGDPPLEGGALQALPTHGSGPFDTSSSRWLLRLSDAIGRQTAADAVQYLTRMSRLPQLTR